MPDGSAKASSARMTYPPSFPANGAAARSGIENTERTFPTEIAQSKEKTLFGVLRAFKMVRFCFRIKKRPNRSSGVRLKGFRTDSRRSWFDRAHHERLREGSKSSLFSTLHAWLSAALIPLSLWRADRPCSSPALAPANAVSSRVSLLPVKEIWPGGYRQAE